MALSPPWDYDGLMYHLQAPRLFLEHGGLLLMPDLWQANGPLATEMLFAIGLGFGSDTFAKVLHLSFGVLLVLTTIALGERVLGGRRGTLAGLVLLGLPTLPFWASAAYADVAWAAFESLAILAVVVWLESKQARALLLAGLMAGLALSTKSMAWFLLPCLVLPVLARRWRQWAAAARDITCFLVPALLLSSPWYLKNLILGGNPLYPLVLGGLEWPAERLALLDTCLQSFGMGRTLLDYLLLPIRIYLFPTLFGTFARGNELPSYLFLLAPLYFLFRPPRSARRPRGDRRPSLDPVGRRFAADTLSPPRLPCRRRPDGSCPVRLCGPVGCATRAAADPVGFRIGVDPWGRALDLRRCGGVELPRCGLGPRVRRRSSCSGWLGARRPSSTPTTTCLRMPGS